MTQLILKLRIILSRFHAETDELFPSQTSPSTHRIGEFALVAQLCQQLDGLRHFVVEIDAVLVLHYGGLGSLLLHGAVAFVVASIHGIVVGIDRVLQLEFGVFHAPFDHVLHENLGGGW